MSKKGKILAVAVAIIVLAIADYSVYRMTRGYHNGLCGEYACLKNDSYIPGVYTGKALMKNLNELF